MHEPPSNHVGARFDRLTVTGVCTKEKGKPQLFECQCACGESSVARLHHLTAGLKRSCGCLQDEARRAQGRKNKINMEGRRFGRLVVVREKGRTKNGTAKWVCLCDCGAQKVVQGAALRRKGGTRSCGCLSVDALKSRSKQRRHKDAWRPEYVTFCAKAAARNIESLLTQKQFADLVQQPCHYCGVAPGGAPCTIQVRERGLLLSGIDRKNSEMGYCVNCVPACKACNYAKRTLSYEEFLNDVRRRYLHLFANSSSGKTGGLKLTK